MTGNDVIDIDIVNPALYRNGIPHALYAELRDLGPVLRHPRTHVEAFNEDIEFWATYTALAARDRPV